MSKAEALKKEFDLLPTSPFMTTDLVLVEFANCLAQPPYRMTAATVIDKIRADRNTTLSLLILREWRKRLLSIRVDPIRPGDLWTAFHLSS